MWHHFESIAKFQALGRMMLVEPILANGSANIVHTSECAEQHGGASNTKRCDPSGRIVDAEKLRLRKRAVRGK